MAAVFCRPGPGTRLRSAVHRLFELYLLGLVVLTTACSTALGQLTVRIVDVGAGLCCVAATSDGHYMIYDAGNYKDRGRTAMVAIEQMIPYGSTIDLLVLSHCDADHLAAVPFICENYVVKEVWRDGFDSGRDTWDRADAAVRAEVVQDDCEDNNLQEVDIEPGYSVDVGNATVTFLCGFADIPAEWGVRAGGENRNARSVVVRMDYGEASIMFAGDTVGRHIGDPWNANIAAEKFLVDNSAGVPIDVDVMVAPHHGADNGSSYPFVVATSPEYVIFSAGSHYNHPHYWAANRYLTSGVARDKMFRTDLGDNEGSPEWSFGGGDSPDPAGDDDVLVTLEATGDIHVEYVPPLRSPSVHPFVAHGPVDRSAAGEYSPQIAKWVNNDSLWQETEEHLEDHTIPHAAMLRGRRAVSGESQCSCPCSKRGPRPGRSIGSRIVRRNR